MFPEPRTYRRHVLFFTTGLTVGLAALVWFLTIGLGDIYSNEWGYIQKALVMFGFAMAFHIVLQSLKALYDGPTFNEPFDELERVCRNPRIPEAQ